MLNDNSSAENYYLNLPIFSSGIDLLANTIADLILRNDIILDGKSYAVSLNCDYDTRPEHEKIVLDKLKGEALHLQILVKRSLESTTKKEYKKKIFSSLENKGLMKHKYFMTSKGRQERRTQNNELTKYSKVIKRKNKAEIVESVHNLGGNLYLLNESTKRILKDVFPKSINLRRQILKFMGVSGLADTYVGIDSGWGGIGYSLGEYGGGGFDGGGGGDFGGSGAGGEW